MTMQVRANGAFNSGIGGKYQKRGWGGGQRQREGEREGEKGGGERIYSRIKYEVQEKKSRKTPKCLV